MNVSDILKALAPPVDAHPVVQAVHKLDPMIMPMLAYAHETMQKQGQPNGVFSHLGDYLENRFNPHVPGPQEATPPERPSQPTGKDFGSFMDWMMPSVNNHTSFVPGNPSGAPTADPRVVRSNDRTLNAGPLNFDLGNKLTYYDPSHEYDLPLPPPNKDE